MTFEEHFIDGAVENSALWWLKRWREEFQYSYETSVVSVDFKRSYCMYTTSTSSTSYVLSM